MMVPQPGPVQVPPMGAPMGMVHPTMMPPQIPIHQQYVMRTQSVIPAVNPNVPDYKQRVGEAIYEYVEKISGDEQAPKITGMLIDLPMDDIRAYLSSYVILEEKIRQAENLLSGGQQ